MRVYPLFLQGFKSDEIAKSLNSSNLIETYNENIQFDGYISHEIERTKSIWYSFEYLSLSFSFHQYWTNETGTLGRFPLWNLQLETCLTLKPSRIDIEHAIDRFETFVFQIPF